MSCIAVLMTVHNRCSKTLASLGNLASQKLPRDVMLDVYMVNDGCTDGTEQMVKKRFPFVQIIQGDGSLFWNRGMWTAWDVASKTKDYEYYLWLNDDTDMFPDALESLLTLSMKKGNKAIIVGATKDPRSGELTYGGRIGKNIAPCDGYPHEVDHFNGNIVLVTQLVFKIVGNLDYYYRHSKGDFDYGIRARKEGVKIYQCGNALGICKAHEVVEGWCNPKLPFLRRWQLMHQPNGMPPKETFHLEKQTNMLAAALHFFTIYIRCVFPQLWVKRCYNQ